MQGSVRYASGDCFRRFCSTWAFLAGVGDRAALTGLHSSMMASGLKGLRSARTWDGQPPGAQKVTRHSAHLDTAVIEPQVSVRRAFARVVCPLKSSLMGLLRTGHAVDDVEVAYEPTAWSAKPESDQPRAFSNHDSAFRSRCTASAIPVCDGTTPPATHDRACPPTRKGATVLASRFCGRTNSRGYASRDCIGAGRPPDGAFTPAGRLSCRGDPEADGAETYGSRCAEVCTRLATMSARRATPRAKPGLRENSVDAMAGISRTTTACRRQTALGRASDRLRGRSRRRCCGSPTLVSGVSQFLEHPWKTMERLVGTSARRGIPV